MSGTVDTQAQRELAAASEVSWIPTLIVINSSRSDDVARHIFLSSDGSRGVASGH